MSTTTVREPPSTLNWNLRQLYWDIFYFGILAGSTLAFQSVYAARLGASGFQIGLLSAGPAIVGLIFTLPSGRWLENKSFIEVTFQSSILQRLGFVFLVALPWLFPSEAGQTWGLILTTLGMSVGGTLLAISFNALFAEVVPPEQRAHAVGIRNILLAISVTASTLISGQILDGIAFPHNYQVVFLLGATGAMMSSFHLGRIRKPDALVPNSDNGEPIPAAAPPAARPKAWLRLDLLTGPFGIFMVAYLAFYIFQYFPLPIFPLAYVDTLHLTDGTIGIGTAIFYAAMLLASIKLSQISARYGHRMILFVSAALFPLYPLFLGIARGPGLYYVACLTGGAVYALLNGGLINRLMERVPADDRAAHMAIHQLVLNIGVLGGSLLGPVAASAMGIQPAILISAGLRLVAAGFLWLWG